MVALKWLELLAMPRGCCFTVAAAQSCLAGTSGIITRPRSKSGSSACWYSGKYTLVVCWKRYEDRVIKWELVLLVLRQVHTWHIPVLIGQEVNVSW